MTDVIEKAGNSLIQHGKTNDRVYLMKLCEDDYPGIIGRINDLVNDFGYSKVFAKVPPWAKEGFARAGYETEAYIPDFYGGILEVFFMSLFPVPDRKTEKSSSLIADVLELAKGAGPTEGVFPIDGGYNFSVLSHEDAEEISAVYREVFKTYPFPIHDPDYIHRTMDTNVRYYGARAANTLSAVSSCEMDKTAKNVEMTDFATLPGHRGKGLASYLLSRMEPEMKKIGMMTAYTIARAVSYGMNITFSKNGYTYSGTLINNTNISGSIESMNVWYKSLI
jgi:putative beta-lysine N-acetyltransferase